MVLFVFIVDTSASMNLPLTYTKSGLSKLDVAKTGIETFFKVVYSFTLTFLVLVPSPSHSAPSFNNSNTLRAVSVGKSKLL